MLRGLTPELLESAAMPIVDAALGRATEFFEYTAAGGYQLALALVCLMQYAFHVYRLGQAGRRNDRVVNEMHGLEVELQSVERERVISRLENHILREFVSQTEIDKALDLLLMRFAPDEESDFAAFAQINEADVVVCHHRGLDPQSASDFAIDPPLLERLREERTVTIPAGSGDAVRLMQSLAPVDRRKVRDLHLIAVGENQSLSGVLLATSLYPGGAAVEQQLELARRLMQSVGGNLKQLEAFEMQENRLRLTGEMLELRAIADREFGTPMEMVTEFLERLVRMLSAERATLYLTSRTSESSKAPFVRCGADMPDGEAAVWQDCEDRLAAACGSQRGLCEYTRADLDELAIGDQVGWALVSRLSGGQSPTGDLCLTRRNAQPLTRSRMELAEWASGFLGERIVRVLNLAAVERRARLDGLTDLANRRTFDEYIHEEVAAARHSLTDCSLLMFDLDEFKTVNDTWGHQAGDKVLKAVADVLREQAMELRSGDRALIARYGGEELAMLLPGMPMSGALRIAEAVRAAVEELRIPFRGRELTVTTSVGVAAVPDHCSDVDGLIAAADAALYRAKQAGRNRAMCASQRRKISPAVVR